MPKRPCTCRAEWRLLPGKNAQRLSAHYQLDCDYGTPVIAIFRESENNEPIYLCEVHVTEMERSNKNGGKVRSTEARPTDSYDRTKCEDQTERTEPLVAKPNWSTPRVVETQRADTEERTAPANQASGAEVAATQPNGSNPSSVISRPTVAESPARSSPARVANDSVVRTRVRDLTYGDSVKALVDESIWNLTAGDYEAYRSALQLGNPAIQAAQAAGGQLAVIVRKMCEYSSALEALLSPSKPTISAVEVIHKPLELATLDLIGNEEIDDGEKDAAIEQLGAFQESLNRGLDPQITPLQALRIAFAVGDRARWGATSDLRQELKVAYAAVYTNVRNAIIAAAPDALRPFERLANLHTAKAELDSAYQSTPSDKCDTVSTTA